MLTASQFASCLLQVSSILSCSDMDCAVERLSGLLISPPGYERPVHSLFQSLVDRQAIPAAPGSAEALLSERRFILPHWEQATSITSTPLQSLLRNVRRDLQDAVDWQTQSFAGDGVLTAARRRAIEQAICSVRASLSRVDARLDALRCEGSLAMRMPGQSLATVEAMRRCAGLPASDFVAHMLLGFPCVGVYRDTGLFRLLDIPRMAEERFGSLHHQAQIDLVVSRLWGKAEAARWDPHEQFLLEQVTELTYAEVAKALADGPWTEEQLNDRFGKGKWRPMEGFGIIQGLDQQGRPKCRRCDNAKASRTNACTSTFETIAVEDATFPAVVAALFHRAFGGRPPPLGHSTDDVDAAYRRLVAAHAEATVVAIYDTRVNDVTFWTMHGHNFGLVTAVLSFNTFSQLAACFGRRYFGLPVAAYFDDYDICEPLSTGRSPKRALNFIHELMGVPLSIGDKDVSTRPSNAFLGVITDLSRIVEGIIVMRSKPSRVAKLVLAMQQACDEGFLSYGECGRMAGKLEYTVTSASSGRVGRAALAALRAYQRFQHRQGADDSEGWMPDYLWIALQFFIELLPLLPPRVFDLNRRPRSPVIVYTDAMWASRAGYVGIVIFDPDHSETGWPKVRYASAPVPESIIRQLDEREQQIGVLEALAAAAAYSSAPDQLRGRDVVHFIDNTGAMFGLSKGASRDYDTSRMAHVFQVLAAALSCRVWFEYVPSGANISDLPSRQDLTLLRSMGAVEFQLEWPPFGGSWSAVLSSTFAAYSGRRSGAVKRSRAEVGEALNGLRRKASRIHV